MTNLIHRLEAAEGPSRELDGAIAESLGWTWLEPAISGPGGWFPPDGEESEAVPSYTASLDAAVSLVPKGWALKGLGEMYIFGAKSKGRHNWFVELHIRGRRETNDDIDAFAATPALALCIAALKAREAGDG